MTIPRRFCLIIPLALTLLPAIDAFAQSGAEKFEHWPVDLKINGRIIVNNGVRDFGSLAKFFSEIAKHKKVVFFTTGEPSVQAPLAESLEMQVGDEGEFKTVNFDEFPSNELKSALSDADVVVIQTTEKRGLDVDALQNLRSDFNQFVENNGTLVVDAAIAPWLGEYSLKASADGSGLQIQAGLNLLPSCILRCGHGTSRKSRGNLLCVLAIHPRSIGVEIAGETMLMLSGRKMTCYGAGTATFMLMANERSPLRIESIAAQRSDRQSPQSYLLDLTEWRRDAIDRTIDPFPPAEPDPPFVDRGTLLIVGGGGLPVGLMERLVELAGGVENAKLVYVPCSEEDTVGESQGTVQQWKKMGVKQATFIHTKDRNRADGDEQFLAPLKDASGIWFGGGRQWNFSDSYYGTKAHRLMKDVLRRGGVIGGSSAGASIQARYLARATPIGNFQIMAPGYERGGLGFISGVAIDQHFSQRGRQKDMTGLVNRYPQLLGIGLDERTAIIVKKSRAEVVGRGRAHFYDRNLPVYPDQPDYIALPAGSSYDLAARKVLVDTTKTPSPDQAE